ncbi:hypothetical protein AB835_09810 [Candidatus Endobugula sertula]|uniref:Uncharacterized protein n=1 Tax=Candidatus Endobugula sertula TaxID=62101 RepID=A0A1D2QNY8_9GAMM|nr:hypothetical protein AB835_09810 [Candidatus Endobugula sertula]
MKLVRPQIFQGREKAIKHVTFLAKKLSIQVPKQKSFKNDISLESQNKTFKLNFYEEVEHVRKTGKANMLQSWFDAEDRFLQPAIELHLQGGVQGVEFTLNSTIGSHTSSVSSNGILESPEVALANDICFFHKETCELYNSTDIRGFSRSFRGYLHSCVSLVDCFLFKYTFHIRDMIGDTSQYTNTLTLDSKSNLEDRLEAWMLTFATHEANSFKNWNERSKFIELKKRRNQFMHPTTPAISYEPQDVVKLLNYGSDGVGKLLGKMRKSSGTSDRIGFIHQISSLPKVSISKR